MTAENNEFLGALTATEHDNEDVGISLTKVSADVELEDEE